MKLILLREKFKNEKFFQKTEKLMKQKNFATKICCKEKIMKNGILHKKCPRSVKIFASKKSAKTKITHLYQNRTKKPKITHLYQNCTK